MYLERGLAMKTLLGHLGVELATLEALARRGQVAREHGLGHYSRILSLARVLQSQIHLMSGVPNDDTA